MSWFRVDHDFPDHPKARAAGRDGRQLWLVAGCRVARPDGGGVVTQMLLEDAVYRAELTKAQATSAITRLTQVVEGFKHALWHESGNFGKCEDCVSDHGTKRMPSGLYVFHNWARYQQSKEENATPHGKFKARRERDRKRQKQLCEQIKERDGSLCRYCGVRVVWGDQRSVVGATYDHVDPDGWNDFENLVISCRGCNSKKAERTPAEAAMPLLPPPFPHGATGSGALIPDPTYLRLGANSVRESVRTQTEPGLHPVQTGSPLAYTRDSGESRVRTGSEPGEDRVQTESTPSTNSVHTEPTDVHRLPTGGDVA